MSDVTWSQLDMFEEAGMPVPHARMTDPVSSDLTVKSLGGDTSYNWRIFARIMWLSQRSTDIDGLVLVNDVPVTDDMILDEMERFYNRRYQRNVIARQRGLLRELGWIKRVDDVTGVTGRPTIAHIPTEAGIRLWNEHVW